MDKIVVVLSVVTDVVLLPQRPYAPKHPRKHESHPRPRVKKTEGKEKKFRLDSNDFGLATWSVTKETSDII